MNRNITSLIAIACSLALTVSTPATNAFGRGGGGGGGGSGHSSSGTSRSGHTMSTPQSSSRSTTNFSTPNSRMSNSHTSSHSSFENGTTKNGITKNKFVSNKFQKQTMHKFAHSKSKYWKKYGWGFVGFWGCDFGWGWGCWSSPWCYAWCWYDPLPVAAFYNPYCDCAGTVVDGVDYSAPISNLPANTVAGDDSDAFASARQAFVEGNVDAALSAISVAVLQMPQSQDVHQFHSLVLFARGDYCRSATVAYAVLQEGPGWSWNTLQGFYPSPEIYTEQLRRLEHYVNDHRDEANARFLLGYHYLMLNHGDAGHRQMQQVVETQPKDKLAQNIVTGMNNAVSARLAVAKEEVKKPAPDNTLPPNDNSAELETIIQAKTPAKITPAKATPIVDEKSSTDDDADQAPVNNKPEKVVVKRKADKAPAEDKSEKADTDRDADKSPANDKSEKVPAKDKADTAPTAGKPEKASTDDDDDDDKTPTNDKSAKVTKGNAQNASTDEKSDKASTDDGQDQPSGGDKSNKVATKGKADHSSTYEEEDQPAANNKAKEASAKRNAAKVSAESKTETVITDDKDNRESDKPAPEVVRPKLIKRTTPANGLVGTFRAIPEEGIQIELTLEADQAFTWKFTANGKSQRFSGKYKMSPNSLTLTRDDGESMEGTLERTGNGGFKFRMKNAEADDPGLSFSR
jgi:hypothetical protein